MKPVSAYSVQLYEALIDHCHHHWREDAAGAVATGLAALHGLNEHQGRLARIVDPAAPIVINAPHTRRLHDYDGQSIKLRLDAPVWMAAAAATLAQQTAAAYLFARDDGLPLTTLEYRRLVANAGRRSVNRHITPSALARTMSAVAAEEEHWALLLDLGYEPSTAISRLHAPRIVKLARPCVH